MFAKLMLIPTLATVVWSASCGTSSLPAGVPPSGKVWFGSNFAKKSGALVIVGKKSTFHSTEQVSWVAHFNQSAGAKHVTVEFYALRSGQKTSVSRGQTTMTNTGDDEKAVRIPAGSLINAGATQAGVYGVQYSRGSHVLATGMFHLVR